MDQFCVSKPSFSICFAPRNIFWTRESRCDWNCRKLIYTEKNNKNSIARNFWWFDDGLICLVYFFRLFSSSVPAGTRVRFLSWNHLTFREKFFSLTNNCNQGSLGPLKNGRYCLKGRVDECKSHQLCCRSILHLKKIAFQHWFQWSEMFFFYLLLLILHQVPDESKSNAFEK